MKARSIFAIIFLSLICFANGSSVTSDKPQGVDVENQVVPIHLKARELRRRRRGGHGYHRRKNTWWACFFKYSCTAYSSINIDFAVAANMQVMGMAHEGDIDAGVTVSELRYNHITWSYEQGFLF